MMVEGPHRKRWLAALLATMFAAGMADAGGAQAITVSHMFAFTVPVPATPGVSVVVGSTAVPVAAAMPASSVTLTVSAQAVTAAPTPQSCPPGKSTLFSTEAHGLENVTVEIGNSTTVIPSPIAVNAGSPPNGIVPATGVLVCS